jgi:hypothetical protein
VTERRRRAYLGLARVFLVVGAVMAVLGLADAWLGLGVFRGNPLWTALFLLAIGALLRSTALGAPDVPEEDDPDERHRDSEG